MLAADEKSMIYQPLGGALEIFGCCDPEIVYHGPAGTGKSRADLEKVHLCCETYPGCRWLIVRETRASMTESTLVTFEKKVMNPAVIHYQNVQRKFRHSYEFKNGSSIVTGGMDNPERFMSTEYDGILVVEADKITENGAEMLKTRLRNGVMPFQQIIFETNPASPTHWLKQRIDNGLATEIISRHSDNPSVTPEYLEMLSKLSGHRRARLYLGQWAAAEGLVYENFDRAIHVIDAMPLGWERWRKIRAIDFGYTNPFVCQWWAIDGDGRAYLYREYVKTGVTVRDHAEVIKRYSEGEHFDYTVSDHDAEDRATLAQCGIETIAAIKDVSPGIQGVADRLRIAGDGKPRVFFLRHAMVDKVPEGKPWGTLAEIEGYLWQQPKEGRAAKEEPVKENDHSMDAMRYAIAQIDKPLVPIFAFPEDDSDERRDPFWEDEV